MLVTRRHIETLDGLVELETPPLSANALIGVLDRDAADAAFALPDETVFEACESQAACIPAPKQMVRGRG